MSYIKKTEHVDLPAVMEIIDEAKAYMRKSGIDQWQRGYPSEETIKEDIKTGDGYLLVSGRCGIIGTFCLTFSHQPEYDYVEEGGFSVGTSAALHRVAIKNSEKGRGRAAKIVKFAAEECEKQGREYLRIDTHKNNLSMQRMLIKNGFSPVGFIYTECIRDDIHRRIAFEMKIGNK